jgi:hypothetical protein
MKNRVGLFTAAILALGAVGSFLAGHEIIAAVAAVLSVTVLILSRRASRESGDPGHWPHGS